MKDSVLLKGLKSAEIASFKSPRARADKEGTVARWWDLDHVMLVIIQLESAEFKLLAVERSTGCGMQMEKCQWKGQWNPDAFIDGGSWIIYVCS
ncbi:hypothetical protein NPIL_667951 [Nephila pilipes]|uniref:Uncharacterized protein n=1 Tax=Nephila pilipes TaxID=299642 RepID=A0A8X6TG75_NEPPI|nr:hypothetical protein NPIL_667951 [Nephila pilipes]